MYLEFVNRILLSRSSQVQKLSHLNRQVMDHGYELFKIWQLFNMFKFPKQMLWEIDTQIMFY